MRELERRVVEADGGRLKLEWGTLTARSGDEVEDLLWWEGEALVGFLGLYSYGSSVELAGMVDPAARRRGIATRLLDAALRLCLKRHRREALLVVPRPSVAGRHLALGLGAELEHSEHAMALIGDPDPGPGDSSIFLRTAREADKAVLSSILEHAFGHPASEMVDELGKGTGRTLMAERDGRPVGTVRLTRQGDEGGIYGLAVDPAWQRRGVGRDVLRQACARLRADGARRIGLEVAVGNDHALGLYTSIGFAQLTTEDYFRLPLG